jgi:hypothetical protein
MPAVRVLYASLALALSACGASLSEPVAEPSLAPPAAETPQASPDAEPAAKAAGTPLPSRRPALLAIDPGPPKQMRHEPAEPSDLCRRTMPKLVGSAGRLPAVPDFGAAGFAPKRLLATCWPAKGGAWAVVPSGLKAMDGKGDEPKILGTMALVFLRASGAVVRGPAMEYHATTTETVRFYGQPLRADTDEPRLALVRARGGRTGDGYADGSVYALRKGRIVPLALPARSIAAAIDVDGDGLDDLLTDWPFAGETCTCDCQAHTSQIGPTLLLHAGPKGTFRTDDDVARAWASAECPEHPEGAPPPSEVPGDFSLLRWVRCSRLYGVPSGAVRAAIETACASRAKDACDPCRSPRLVLDWADTVPPFELR